ncbi:hypothetical protein Hanom_Chr06g00504241 [Helianthus anomalus]
MLWNNIIARYRTCLTTVVWATDVGFIYQMGSLTHQTSLLVEFSRLVCNIGIRATDSRSSRFRQLLHSDHLLRHHSIRSDHFIHHYSIHFIS